MPFRDKMKAKNLVTVDELRAQKGLESLPNGEGRLILDPTWVQRPQAEEPAEKD